MPTPIRAAPFARPWPWLIALWVVVTLANLWKPFQLDDTAHLEIARWIAGHPTRPMSGPLNWVGLVEPIHRTNQPHLFFYLMAGWGRLFGWTEMAMHALQALAAGACVVLLHRIAQRIVPDHALWVTAIVVLSPAFVVSQNMMGDVPLLALWLWFFDALLDPAPSGGRTRRYLIAAIACTAAILTKYSSLALLPILAAVPMIERRWRSIWVIAVPLAGIAAWSAFNVWDYGGIHIAQRNGGSSDALRPFKFIIAWGLILGGVSPIGLAITSRWSFSVRGKVSLFVVAGTALAALAVLVAMGIIAEPFADRVLWVAFAVNGLLIALTLVRPLAMLTRTAFAGLGGLQAQAVPVVLALWVFGAGAFYVLFPAFSAVRHVLTVLPGLTLLACLSYPEALTRPVKVAALTFMVPITMAVSLADYRFADFYRNQSTRIAAALSPQLPAGGTIWTSGHWGWQWYAERAGMQEIDYRRSVPRPGDFYIEAIDVDHQFPTQRLALARVAKIAQHSHPLNPFCTARPDHFYRSGSRFGPWSLSRACEERLLVYRVVRDRPPAGSQPEEFDPFK